MAATQPIEPEHAFRLREYKDAKIVFGSFPRTCSQLLFCMCKIDTPGVTLCTVFLPTSQRLTLLFIFIGLKRSLAPDEGGLVRGAVRGAEPAPSYGLQTLASIPFGPRCRRLPHQHQ